MPQIYRDVASDLMTIGPGIGYESMSKFRLVTLIFTCLGITIPLLLCSQVPLSNSQTETVRSYSSNSSQSIISDNLPRVMPRVRTQTWRFDIDVRVGAMSNQDDVRELFKEILNDAKTRIEFSGLEQSSFSYDLPEGK